MTRVRAPARPADADRARMKEGPPPSPPRKEWRTALQSALTHGDWSNGRTPALQVRQSRSESGLPKNPNKRGRGVPAPRPLISTQGFGPLSIDRPKYIARTAPAFQSRAHSQSRNLMDWPRERSLIRTTDRCHQCHKRRLLHPRDRAPDWHSSRYDHAPRRARRLRRDRVSRSHRP